MNIGSLLKNLSGSNNAIAEFFWSIGLGEAYNDACKQINKDREKY